MSDFPYLTKRQRNILSLLISADRAMNASEVGKVFQRGWSTATNDLMRLKGAGLVRRTDTVTGHVVYEATERGRQAKECYRLAEAGWAQCVKERAA